MNPIFERKLFLIRYVALYALFAAAYAAVFGSVARLGAGVAVLDGFVVLLVSGLEGLMLWSILKYGTEGISGAPLRTAFYFTVGVLFVGVAIAAESLAVYGAAERVLPDFTRTIPARGLCFALVYVLFALFYTFAGRSNDDEIGQELAADSQSDPIERVTVRGGQKIKVIGVGDIIYLQAEGDYVAIVTAEGRWLKEQTMKYFEENLPRVGFVRVHRSYIVSVSHISRIEQSGREHRIVLRDGTAVRISDAGYKTLKQRLGL